VFDNGTPCEGKLLAAFCTNLTIRLLHTALAHLQTKGMLERAFRDDMGDFTGSMTRGCLTPYAALDLPRSMTAMMCRAIAL